MACVRTCVVVVTAGLVAAGCGEPDLSKGDACVVEGSKISRATMDRRIEAALVPDGSTEEKQTPSRERREAVERQVVDSMVQERLLDHAPELLELEIDDKDVDRELARLRKELFGNDKKRFAEGLEQQGITRKELRRTIRRQLIMDAIHARADKQADVSEKAARAWYDKHREQFAAPEQREVQVLRVDDETRARSLAARARGMESQAFATLVRESSNAPDAADGGERTMRRGAIPAVLETAVFALDTGEVSRAVKAPDGWYVVRAAGDAEEGTRSFKDVRTEVTEQLRQAERTKRVQRLIAKLRREGEVRCADDLSWSPKQKTPKVATQPSTQPPTDGTRGDGPAEAGETGTRRGAGEPDAGTSG